MGLESFESPNYLWALNEIANRSRIILYSKSICSLYSVSIEPPYHGAEFPANMSEWYANEVFGLPNEVNGTNIGVF